MNFLLFIVFLIPSFSYAAGFDDNTSDTTLADSYFQQGDSCRIEERFDDALNRYFEAAALYDKNDMMGKTAVVYNRIGKVYRLTGNYEKALESDIKSLQLVDNLPSSKNKALYLNNIGIDQYRLHNFDKALEFLNESLQMRKAINDRVGIADAANNIGMVYDDKGESEKALDYYTKALDYYKEINELDGMAAAYNNIAGIYFQKQELDKVLEYALKSLDIRKKLKNKRNIAFNMINIGSVFNELGKTDSAISYINQGIELAKEVGTLPQVRYGYKTLSRVYSSANDYRNAYFYQKKFSEVNDSIFREKRAKAIAEMETRFETEKKIKENEILKKDIEIKKHFQMFFIVVILGLVVLTVNLYYFFRLKSKSLKQNKKLLEQEKELYRMEKTEKESQKKILESRIFAEKQINRLQKEKYESELQLKNEQLTNSALCIVNKNEVLSQIKEKIKHETNLSEPGKVIGYELIRFINNNIDFDQDWKKFKLKFEDAHPGFFDRLKEKYPGLSENYIKLCAYLRISLNTREIAQLMNITIDSVKKNRQRLRKKLEIPADVLLVDFMKTV